MVGHLARAHSVSSPTFPYITALSELFVAACWLQVRQ